MPKRRWAGPLRNLVPLFVRELVNGSERSLRDLTFDLFVQGQQMAEFFDVVIRPSLSALRMGCNDSSVREFELRRGIAIMNSILTELRSEVPINHDGPLACGGTLDNGALGICSTMAEIVFRREGWRTCSFGAECPSHVFSEAGKELRPNLMWIGVSSDRHALGGLDDGLQELRNSISFVAERLHRLGIPLFVGYPEHERLVGLPGDPVVSSRFVDLRRMVREVSVPYHQALGQISPSVC